MNDDVERVARSLCRNAGLDPDALTPAPRGRMGLIPKWQNFTRFAQAAMRETRLIDADALRGLGLTPKAREYMALASNWLKGRADADA